MSPGMCERTTDGVGGSAPSPAPTSISVPAHCAPLQLFMDGQISLAICQECGSVPIGSMIKAQCSRWQYHCIAGLFINAHAHVHEHALRPMPGNPPFSETVFACTHPSHLIKLRFQALAFSALA